MTRNPNDPHADSVRDQAIAWLVRVESDAATEVDWRGLEAWLEQAADHRAAFEDVEVMSSALADSADEIRGGLAGDEPVDGVEDLTAHRRPSRRIWIGAAISAAAAVLVATVSVSLFNRPVTAVYETARGQTRTVSLADGTRIDMNGSSRLSVRYEHGERRVFMNRSEAAFDVAHDASRPFIIETGDQRVQVVGTRFNVRNDGQVVTVTVQRGVVRVGGLRGGDAARLTAGRQISHRIGATTSQVSETSPDDALAWTSGQLICRDRRLADIVDDLNRRLPIPMVVEGPARDLRFTGVLQMSDQEAVLKALQAYLPIRVTRDTAAIHLVSR